MDENLYFSICFIVILILGYFMLKYLNGDYSVMSEKTISQSIYIVDGKHYMKIISKITYANGRYKYKTDVIQL